MYSSVIQVSLNQRCPHPDLEGCIPAGFCVLHLESVLLSCRLEDPAGLRPLGSGHRCLKPCWLAVLGVMKCEHASETMKRSFMTTDHWPACSRSTSLSLSNRNSCSVSHLQQAVFPETGSWGKADGVLLCQAYPLDPITLTWAPVDWCRGIFIRFGEVNNRPHSPICS